MRSVLCVVTASFAMLLACGNDAPGVLPGGEVTDESALTKKAPVEALMSSLAGRWYGEVPNVYRACAEISGVRDDQPWALQKLKMTIDEGEIQTTTLTFTRNGSAATPYPVYALSVPPSTALEPVFFNGTYVLARGSAQHLAFWQPLADENSTSTVGIEVSREGSTLTLGVMGGDIYCTIDGVTQTCGSGGYRPFALKRGACPL